MITERLKKSDEKASIEDLLYKWNGDSLCVFGHKCCGFAIRTAYQLPLQNRAGRHHSTSQWWLWALQQCGRKSESSACCAQTWMTAINAVATNQLDVLLQVQIHHRHAILLDRLQPISSMQL